MSGFAPALVQLLSVVAFSFGAVSFMILTAFYWRNPASRTSPLGLFSIACAGAFLANVASALLLTDGRLIEVLQSVCTGLLPPLMLHIVIHSEVGRAPTASRPFWTIVLASSYATALAVALARGLQPNDRIDTGAQIVIAVITGLSLIRLWSSADTSLSAMQERRWLLAIFGALFCCAVAELAGDYPVLAIAPDYLLLTFFAVRLYYSERFAFFDLFLKGGAYFATGLIVLTLAMTVSTAASARFGNWDRLWIGALLSMPVWLLAPRTSRMLTEWIDRRVLKRRYSAAAAESVFVHAVQNAGTEDELLKRAEETLRLIFECPVDVDLKGAPSTSLRSGDVVVSIVPSGTVRLEAADRPGPFLSEELRLLHALTVILGTTLHSLQLRCLREEQHVREQELRALTTRAELRALRAQINPHFLFNALNAVAGCIRTRPEVADETLAELAQVFRYTLARSDKEWVRLREELDFVQSYLAVERTRFGDRLRVAINADRGTTSVIVPAMILQPVVENAIKHGTSRLVSSSEVEITADVSLTGVLTITVSDNGPGFPADMPPGQFAGHGLRNVAERLRRYYGSDGRLQWQNGAGTTIVTIEIPTEAVRQCVS